MEATILLVDDHPLFRKGLHVLLEEESDMRVVGEAGDGQAAIDLVRELAPDVVVMDITMPDLDGIEATRRILSESPQTKVVALSIHAGERFLEGMLEAGARGYILKDSVPEELIHGIRAVKSGQVYLSASITEVVVSEYRKRLSGADWAGEDGELAGDESVGEPILRTKMHRPPLALDIVPRARLVDLLQAGRHRPLTVISAPAGYGKSTLAGQWLETIDCPSAWVSLDEDESDLRLFLTYLLAAIQDLHPGLSLKTQSLLGAPDLPPVSMLARYVLNDLDEAEEPFILVLDDYHHITESLAHDLLAELVRYPSPKLHLVLIGRRDPPLPVAGLRARGQLIEIGMGDLRFTAAETSAFLEQATGVSVDDETATLLERKVEGWVTGLRLLALSLGQEKDIGRILQGLEKAHYYVNQYLIQEVLSQVPPAVARYLLETSILDRFCAPLCEAVCFGFAETHSEMDAGGMSMRAFIEWLEETHLFVIPLDDTHHWFCYHHLFQQLLLDQLKHDRSAEEVAGLYARASRWLAENELIDEALRHALAAEDVSYAVHLVEQHRYDLMNTEQWQRLERWLKMLPPETVEKNPILLSTQACLYDYNGQVVETFAYRDQAESLVHTLPPESPEGKAVRGEIMMLHSEQHVVSGDGDRAIECAERALRLVPAEALHIRSFARGFQTLAYQTIGKLGKGLKVLDEELKVRALSSGISRARMNIFLGAAYWMDGDLNSFLQPALRSLDIGEQYALPESITFARYFLGVFDYVRNELPEAERYSAAVVADPFTARPMYFAHSAFTLALIYTSQGRIEEASNIVESVISHTIETNDTLALATARAFQVELALRQGKIAEAAALSEHVSFDLLPPLWFYYVPQLTPVKLLLARNTPESLEEALTLLDQLDGFLRKTNRKTIRIDVLALQALILDAQGEEPAALENLTESLALAEPGGFIRNFVDMGPKMAELLTRLKKQDVATDYVEQILAAFRAPQPALSTAGGPAVSSTPQAELVEPLTKRELQTLRLLATDLSTEEIAAEMVVAVSTARTHAKRIYSKLGAHSRYEAVQRARELGLL